MAREALAVAAKHTEFVAVWFDPKKVQAEAEKRGWDPKSGDGYLDFYHPEEDRKAGESKSFPDLDSAVAHLKVIVAAGGDVFGQGHIHELEILPRGERCRFCVCNGFRLAKTHWVDETGLSESYAEDNGCQDED
jgi:hypothetical protein